jgi:hypothetical protein
LSITAVNADTGNQVTTNTYGVTKPTSALYSNDRLRLVTIRDATTGATEFNRQGETKKQTDASSNRNCYDVNNGTSWILNQQRTFNDRNEITAITEDPGQPAWVTPVYDNNGNMTLCPQPGDLTAGYDLAFDAWNRLVEIHQSAPESSSSSSGTQALVSTYEYDATGRRTVKYVDADGTYEHFYTGPGGELLETRESTSPSTIPTDFKHQYTWSLASGGPLRRHIDTTSGSSSSSSTGEPVEIFYLTDAAGNTTSIVDDLGTALERYMYDAYGTVTFLDENCTPSCRSLSFASSPQKSLCSTFGR